MFVLTASSPFSTKLSSVYEKNPLKFYARRTLAWICKMLVPLNVIFIKCNLSLEMRENLLSNTLGMLCAGDIVEMQYKRLQRFPRFNVDYTHKILQI